MRNLFNPVTLIAAAAILFTGCTKDQTETEFGTTGNKIKLIASANTPETATRTVIGDRTDQGTYPVYWNDENEALAIVETVDGKDSEAIRTGEYTLSEDKTGADFSFELTENNNVAAFDYYACYPFSAFASISTSSRIMQVNIPMLQRQAANSADPNASILFACDTGHNSQPSALNLNFRHVVAYAKMTVTGLPVTSNTAVDNVTFTAAENSLSGEYWYYYDNPDGSKDGGNSDNVVSINVDGTVNDGSQDFVIWFACMPTSVGSSFTVSIQADSKIYTRDVTIPDGRAIDFIAGQVSAFTVDMSDATVSNVFSGSGTENDPYTIYTSQQLVKMVQILNGELTTDETATPMDEAYYALGADIDMKDVEFVPAVSFKGHFNGNGYTISNLTITPVGTAPVAIFGTMTGGEIRNLDLDNVRTTVTEEAQLMTAALVGKCDGTTIDNCHVNGNILSGAKATFASTGASNGSCSVVGGLVAYAMNSSISGCSFDGYVSGKNQFAGGIVAVAEGTKIDNCTINEGAEIACMMNHAGGIASLIRLETEISNCKVEGSIKCNYANNGGIVGKIEGGRVENCVVSSNASVQGHVNNTSYSYLGTGGIVGYIYTTTLSHQVYINNCACYCPVSANVAIGGIAGYIKTANAGDNVYITNCLYKGSLTAVSKNAYNYGIAAGIAAYCHDTDKGDVHIANCASLIDGISFLSTATAAGFGGLGGYVRYNVAFDTCYSNLEVADIVSFDQNLPITDYSSILQYGGLYGASYSSATNVSYTHCYYSDSGKVGRDLSGTPTKVECEAISNQAMTDGTLLASLNSAADAYNATAAPEVRASSWIANTDGYPIPSSVPADPGFGSTTSKTRVSLIGDSISTFSGYLPAGYNTFYPTGSVISASQTYWYKLIYNYMSNAKLDMNIAWTGTLVTRCTNTKYASEHWYGHDFCARFIDKGMGNPDVILIHGGTNDVSGRGEVSLYPNFAIDGAACPDDTIFADCFATAEAATSRSAIEELDDTCFVNAYIKLISLIHQQYPDAKVVMLIGDWLPAGARQTIHKIADHCGALYGYKCVDFQDIEQFEGTSVIPKETGCHPNEAGFEVMASYIYEQVGSYID